MTDDHLKYLWAAYRSGGLEEIEPDLDRDGFIRAVSDYVSSFVSAGGVVVVGVATNPVQDEPMPIGLFWVTGMSIVEPHVKWFPWATTRNKIELGLRFLIELKKEALALVPVSTSRAPDDVTYLKHLCDYGVLRIVGTVRDYFSEGDHALLFQTVGR